MEAWHDEEETSTRRDVATILEDDRKGLARRRWVSIWLGGIRFLGQEGGAPLGVHIMQFLLLLLPLYGGILLVVSKIRGAPWIMGGYFAFCVLVCQTIGFLAMVRKRSKTQVGGWEMNENERGHVFPDLAQMAVSQPETRKASFLDEEDVVDFGNGVFSAPSLVFLFPFKASWKQVFVDVLVAWLLGSLVGLYLFHPAGHFRGKAQIYLSITVWYLVCVCFRSLSLGPPQVDLNVWKETSSTWHIDNTYSRPFYLGMAMGIFLIHPVMGPVSDIFLVVLPWGLGVGFLPPIDALLIWAGEQVLMFVFGGYAPPSNFGLMQELMLSWGVSICLWALALSQDPGGGTVALAITAGRILSRTRGVAASMKEVGSGKGPGGNPPPRRWPLFVRSIGMVSVSLVIGACAGVLHATANGTIVDFHARKESPTSILPLTLGVAVLFMWLVQALLGILQRPLLTRWVRNPLWSKESSIQSIMRMAIGPSVMKPLGGVEDGGGMSKWCHRCLRPKDGWKEFFLYWIQYGCGQLYSWGERFVLPIVSIASFATANQVSLLPHFHAPTHVMLWECALLLRASRWVWESPVGACRTVAFVNLYRYLSGVYTGRLSRYKLSICAQLAVAAFVDDRVQRWYAIFRMHVTTVWTTYTSKRQRPSGIGKMVLLNIVAFPYMLYCYTLAAILGSGMVPILGLPLFMVNFPHPARFWARLNATPAESNDAVFYEQLVAQIIRTLPAAFRSGVLGEVVPGNVYLIRNDKRLLFCRLLARGCSHYTVNFRGLELKGTSCHNIEAAALEQSFDRILGNMETLSSKKCRLLRPWISPKDAMLPFCSLPVLAYMDASFQMTGIIEDPVNLRLIPSSFLKVLVWLLHRKSRGLGGTLPASWCKVPLSIETLQSVARRFPARWYSFVKGLDGKHGTPAPEPEGEERKDALIPVALACFAICEVLSADGMDPVQLGPKHVLDTFCGILGIGEGKEKSWLYSNDEDVEGEENVEEGVHRQGRGRGTLIEIVLRSYRYACKLVYDQAVHGEIESFEELEGLLDVYEGHWHVGPVESEAWNAAMRRRKPCLFGLNRDEQGVYRGRVLLVREQKVQVGRLESEVLNGYWSNVTLESFFLATNDDERFSVQACPHRMRNLCIQASEPPLGYPLYTSGPIVLDM